MPDRPSLQVEFLEDCFFSFILYRDFPIDLVAYFTYYAVISESVQKEDKFMVKMVVFSDSHGDPDGMERVLMKHHSDADYVLHLGDGNSDLDRISHKFPRMAMIGVLGNCDWGILAGEADKQRVLDIEGVRIFICHGHRYGVRNGTGTLIYAAEERNADIDLYGHTHCSECFEFSRHDGKTLHVMNPGSISRPRGGEIAGKSYGLILVDGHGGVSVSICPYIYE